MKKTILISFTALLTHSTYAHWTVSGTNIYNPNTGNVGIGTTSPSGNLQVGTSVGAVISTPVTLSLGGTFSSTHGINPKLKIYDDGTNFWGLGISSGLLDYIVSASTYDHTLCRWHRIDERKGKGNVGIGTTSPTDLLTLSAGAYRKGSKSVK